jgi:predicted DsbA family dithiol-disulfide isomerase
MHVEIWSDVVCPWCGIGQARLDAALAAFPERDAVTVIHRSFQLDPRMPADTTRPVRDLLREKYRMSDVQIDATHARITALAAAEGLSPYSSSSQVIGNTERAHELLALAADRGLAGAAWRRLYRAYFGEGGSVFDVEALVRLGSEIGISADDTRAALTDHRYRERVRADAQIARDLGVTGVPFVAIDRRYGVSGAQPVAAFTAALNAAWADRPAAAAAAAPACDADGCPLPE